MAQSMLGSVVATSLKKHGKVLYDQVFNAHPVWFWLRSHGCEDPYDGGTAVTEDIEIGMNTNVDWRGLKEEIPNDEQDNIRQCQWMPAGLSGAVPIYWDDEDNNKNRIIDYSESLIKNLKNTMTERLGASIFYSGTAPNGKPTMQGLPAIISASNVYGTLVDEINGTFTPMDRSTAAFAYWRANVLSTAEKLSLNAGTDRGLRGLYDACMQGKNQEQPTLIVMGQLLWEAFESLLLPTQQHQNPKLAEAGFRNLMFDNAAVVWDSNIDATSTVYAINHNWLKLRPTSECATNFKITERHPNEDRLADSILCAYKGQVTCIGPRYQGASLNKSAT